MPANVVEDAKPRYLELLSVSGPDVANEVFSHIHEVVRQRWINET